MPDQIEPGLPAPSAPAGPVGDSEAMAEIESIKSDPNHRLHETWGKDGASHPEIEALYKRAFGTGPDENTAQAAGDIPPEEAAAKAAATETMRGQWGTSFEEKYADAGSASQYLFANRLELFADIMDVAPDLGNDPTILNALAVLGERLRKHKK